MLLLAIILVPLIAAGVIAVGPSGLIKPVALFGAIAQFILAIVAALVFDWSTADPLAQPESMRLLTSVVPDLGINLRLGVDGVAMWLIILTGFLGPLMVIGSFSAITERQKTYYAWLLALQGVIVGVFAALDLVVFYVCFEFTLVPLFVLINLFGSSNRKKAAVKFFLYTFTGSIIALAGLVYVAYWHAIVQGLGWSFALDDLGEAARSMPLDRQALILFAMMLGFGVKVPIFPVHTWLPLAHTEAPTAGSVILAGVLLKLGTYAIYRFVLPFVPDAVLEYAPFFAVLAIIGIVYAGLICWVQRDVKKLVAYSSVSHLGFCVLGLFALTSIGIGGSVLYMINHGLSTGALFFCIGMMYERYHTRSLDQLGGLAARMPVWAFFMVFFTMASVGLPGLNGFVSEIMCLLGTWQSGTVGIGAQPGPLGPWYAAVAGTGMIVAAIYLLFMVGKIVFGPLKEPEGHEHHGPLPVDLSAREIGVLVPLAAACLILGVYPKPVLDTIDEPVAQAVGVYEAAMGVASDDPASENRPGFEKSVASDHKMIDTVHLANVHVVSEEE